MLSLFTIIKSLFAQRLIIYVLAVFLSLVLFNTTYLSLGTYLPILVMAVGLILLKKTSNSKINSFNSYYIGIAIIVLFSTIISGGNNFRECLKIFLTIFFVYKITTLNVNIFEIKFLSLILCLSYCVYAILVIQAIGGDTMFFGRAQITILKSETSLDPNVVSAAFVLPVIISLYNVLYGKMKLLASGLLFIFLIAILALGSRGASLSLVLSSIIIIVDFLLSKRTSIFIKVFILILVAIACTYAIAFISEQDNIFGLMRILDTSDSDASNGRTEIWTERLGTLLYSPLWGYGANYDIGLLHKGMACHNTFVQILHYSGLIGFILFTIPTYRLFKRKSLTGRVKLALFISVFLPILFIDTFQERTLWNFLIFYSLLSVNEKAEKGLLWNY